MKTNIIVKETTAGTAGPLDHLNKVTDRLLESKIGTFNQNRASILEITTSISDWHAHAISSPREEKSYYRSEALLNRLVDELRSGKLNSASMIQGQIQNQVDVDTVNRVLDTWRIICNVRARVSSPKVLRSHTTKKLDGNYDNDNQQHIIHCGGKVLRKLCNVSGSGSGNTDIDMDMACLHPDGKSFNIVMDSYAKYGMIEEANSLLDEMQTISMNGQPQCRPSTITYNTILSAYANAINMTASFNDKITYANEATEKLDDMINLYNETQNPDIKPDVISFSTAIAACANAAVACPTLAQDAENILQLMTEMYRSSLPQNGGDGEWISIMPNQICYSKAINAWSNSDARDAVDRASRIFESMHGNGDGDEDSDTIQSGVHVHVHDHSNSIETTTALIGAYANMDSKDSIHHAEMLLKKAQESTNATSMPNSITYTAFLDCLAQSAGRALDGDGGEAAMKAEAIVKEMEEMYENGNRQMKPCVITMNALLNVWAKTKTRSRDSGEKADKILQEMERRDDISPDATSYTSVIDAYSRSGYGRKAERILMKMIHGAKNGNDNCIPSTISFACVINGYSGKPRDAERILKLMENICDGDEGWTHLKPDAFIFNAVLNAYLSNTSLYSIKKSIEVLEKMEKNEVATRVSYTSVIEGLSKLQRIDRDKKMVENMAVDLLNKMWELYDSGRKEMLPTSGAFTNYLSSFKFLTAKTAKSII